MKEWGTVVAFHGSENYTPRQLRKTLPTTVVAFRPILCYNMPPLSWYPDLSKEYNSQQGIRRECRRIHLESSETLKERVHLP